MGGVGVGEQAPDERKMLKRCRVAHSSESGEAELRLDVPDSITTWVAEAVGLSEGKGLGLAERAELRTFKPFFVDFTLPYSLIRGEQTKVPLTVYNYLPTCAEVSLRAGGGGAGGGERRGQRFCICGHVRRVSCGAAGVFSAAVDVMERRGADAGLLTPALLLFRVS